MRYTLLALFGLIGVFARYFLNVLAACLVGTGFPFATMAINATGSFLMGVAYVAGSERMLVSPDLRIGLMAGLLGGFTTFSTFSLDSVTMIAEGKYWQGGVYIAGSVVGGILATILGISAGRVLFHAG